MIEVDVPTVPLTRCHQLAYDWAIATHPLATLPLATLPLPTRPLGTRSR